MRHYEIVLLIHPDQSEQVPAMLERYKGVVTAGGGKVHRVKDWGRRKMAYIIKKHREGQYVLLNVSMTPATTAGLERNIRFQENIIRHMLSVVG